ncbi:uncharacterized protein N7483_002406 [Penicillium malachiteum]|uniref:uncharacterized protein n=1 Tax=Penicillium malachiteum TaxID=1324776 RepID=UPI002549422B|nr:uncharacterized protein N7483_002406 [Penicillium malachiteum]KAJ5737281.1 hypothetical protein N7483_002406 [Penicillium malachiteum]
MLAYKIIPRLADQVLAVGFTEKERALLAKLFITDPEEDLNTLKRIKGNRAPGTCSWFLESNELQIWFRRAKAVSDLERNVLWLYGNPGSGKSTMAMTLAEELPAKDSFSKEDSICSFFFCDGSSENQRKATCILRGLLYQIIKQYPPFVDPLMFKYEMQGERLFTSFDALWAVLLDIDRASKGAEIYCIIDALDECENESQNYLLQQINQSFREARRTNLVPSSLHFLILSRPYPEIKGRLSIFKCVDLGSYMESSNDLITMIRYKVQELAERKKYSESVAQKVAQTLNEKAEGTFLWIGIACEALSQVQSRKAIETLETFPQGLNALYQSLFDAAVESSDADDYLHMVMIFKVVTFALRPLTIVEIAEACQLYLDKDIGTRVQFTHDIIDMCRLLIVVDNGYLRLLHESVRDFLMASVIEMTPLKSNHEISCRCIEVLSQQCRPGLNGSSWERNRGFLAYAILYWPQHASLAQTEFSVQKEHETFFHDALGTWNCWLDYYEELRERSWSSIGTNLSAIHVAARWGIMPLILSFLERIEDKGIQGKSPLLIAAESNQIDAIRLLVDSGACLDSLSDEHQNVLHVACKNGHFDDHAMIEYLLINGASQYTCDEYNMIPVLYAIGDEREDLVRTFLRNGFDLDYGVQRRSWPGRSTENNFIFRMNECQGDLDSGLTVLHFCALNACPRMSALLLEYGADPNARSNFGDTALHLGIRRRLLGRRIDDEWGNGQYAIESLRDLITDHEGSEASDIYRAIDDARIRLIETLLESESIDVNMTNNEGDYPQHVIDFSRSNALCILDKLVEKGADASQRNRARQTCFHLANKARNLEVIAKFVEDGHDIKLRDADGLSPFHHALLNCNADVLQLFSSARSYELSEVWYSLDHLDKSPLHHHVSSVFCSVEVICLLLRLGCDINQTDTEGNSPLGLYLDSFQLSIQKDVFWLLSQKGADLLWLNKSGQNLAHLLMHHQGIDTAIIEFLFETGVDPAAQDHEGKTFIHHGAIHGAFTKNLLDFLDHKGLLNLSTPDLASKTPLDYAKEEVQRESLEDLPWCGRWEESFNNLTAKALSWYEIFSYNHDMS